MMPLYVEELTSMALFARVVQLRSFTAAAQEIGIAKSAISKRISLLEERLGVQLLNRTTRKLSLTEDGLRFYEHCATLITSAQAAEDTVSSSSHVARGILRINAPVTFSQMYLSRAITKFLKQYPEIEVCLSTNDRLIDVVEGGFDIIIRIARLKDTSFVARQLASDRLIVCASPNYLSTAGTPQFPDELIQHNCLHYDLVPLSGEWKFYGSTGPYSVPVHGNFISTDGTVLRQAALEGLGVIVVPSFMVAADLATGRLVQILSEFRRSKIGIYALFTRRKQLPLRTRLLIDHLSFYFSKVSWIELLKSS